MAHAISLKDLLFDDDGFLIDPNSWTAELAQRIAGAEGIPALTEDHWRVMRCLRDHYLQHGSLPPMSHVCRESGIARERGRALFRTPLVAWRTAGLPNPGEEAKSYM
jgi:tRNA 2-thiouridine synthesizing protein E